MELSTEKKYQWNQNWANSIAHTDIEPVVSELKAIEETFGTVTPEFVVESSKNKTSVLHGYFEWDNEKAGHSFRLQQASRLLRHIELKVIKDGEEQTIRVYEVTKPNKFHQCESFYKSIGKIDDVDIERLKNICIGDFNRIKGRLSAHSFDDVILLIDKAIEALSNKEEVNEIKSIPIKPSIAV